jgi:hypothetical protein
MLPGLGGRLVSSLSFQSHTLAKKCQPLLSSTPLLLPRHTFMLQGCRLLLTPAMFSCSVAARAASFTARAGYAVAPVSKARPCARGWDRGFRRQICTAPVCMGRKAAKVAARKVRCSGFWRWRRMRNRVYLTPQGTSLRGARHLSFSGRLEGPTPTSHE